MKITRLIPLLTLATLPWLATVSSAASLGSGFNYSGRLTLNNTPASGSYDLRFGLFDDPSSGSQAGNMVTNKNVSVSSGLFTTAIDCGNGLFNGTAYWLEIAVRPGGSSSPFSVLSPRQPVGAVANAQFAVQSGTASTAKSPRKRSLPATAARTSVRFSPTPPEKASVSIPPSAVAMAATACATR